MPIKVCFVALNAYPAIDPQVEGSFGGIETRSWMFAKALAKHPEFEVSFLVRHWQPLRKTHYEHVQLHLIRDLFYPIRDSLLSRLQRTKNFPWLRLRQPKLKDAFYLPLLAGLKAIKKRPDPQNPSPEIEGIEADLFLTYGVQSHSATVIATGKNSGRPVVLFLGSDSDLNDNYLPGNDFVSEYRDRADVCYWAIQNADQILCQTEFQQLRLQSLFQRESQIISNPIDLQAWDSWASQSIDEKYTAGLQRYALWVGRADAVHKRPQLLLDIARKCPQVTFLMIMNRRDDVVEAQIKRQAPSNVSIVDHVPFDSMPALFASAAMLVNTSALEGFPNTYLQAAASRVPIISLNVEEHFLQAANAGIFANGDIERATIAVKELWTSDELTQFSGRKYIEEHHNLQKQTKLLAAALKSQIESTRVS